MKTDRKTEAWQETMNAAHKLHGFQYDHQKMTAKKADNTWWDFRITYADDETFVKVNEHVAVYWGKHGEHIFTVGVKQLYDLVSKHPRDTYSLISNL